MQKTILFSIFLSSLIYQNNTTAQTKHFQGNWTKLETTYDFKFDLFLEFTGGNQVKGVFHWELVNYDENFQFSKDYYENKIGLQAKEYVRGTYDPATKQYILKGYKKDDPHSIIGLDLYRIKESDKGDIGGDTKANNSWQGRINGQAVLINQV
ncbi:MAG: hypothetical protein R2825_27270 [Saprospiraceae bacterium]